MRIRMLLASVLLAAMGIGTGLFGLTGGGTAHAADTWFVIIDDLAFHPVNLTIQTGDTVVWENVDDNGGGIAHSTKSVDAVWDSGTLPFGTSFLRKFDHPGDFPYYDEFYPDRMKGKITVVDPTEVPEFVTNTPTETPGPTDTPTITPSNTAIPTATAAVATNTPSPTTAAATATASAPANPTATATHAAPLPPNTGSGHSDAANHRMLMLAAALLVASGGFAFASMHRQ